ncbi:MAG: leucine-rich repeat protein [Clostridia bacterium]|nr:leucine-rich repeat protein [Clostridia bacterium]
MKRKCLLVWLMVLLLGLSSAALAEYAQTLDLPDSLTYIEAQAFAGSKAVTRIVMPEHVTGIGSQAFSGCSSLNSIELPDTMESIGSFAFSACYNLKSVRLPDSLTEISEGMFLACINLEEVNIPRSAKSIGEMAFKGCSLTDVVLPQGLKRIEREAFDGCINLGRINIPDSVQTIGDQVFMRCESLTEVVIPEGVTTIGKNAFYGCSGLERIYLPQSVTEIGDGGVDTGHDETVVMVAEGSYAHTWCEQNGVVYDYYMRATPTPTPSSTPSPDSGAVTYRALLIGNTYPDTQMELLGPDNDIAGMKAMLARQSGTPFSVTSRLNVTANEVMHAITSAFSGADSNDVSMLYYSGHGANSTSVDGLGALCCIDDTFVTVNALRTWLDTVPGKKIVLLDSCYSGNYINKSRSGTGAFDAERFNDSVIAAFSAKTRANLESSGYYVITACSKDQNSYSLGSASTNFWYGLFTYGVTKGSGFDMLRQTECSWYADSNGDEAITLEEAYGYVVSTVRGLGYEQAAQYYGETDAVLWKK